MTRKLRIGILHYHWLRGGVYTVVNNNLKALIAYGTYRQLNIDLISRDAAQPPGQALIDELNLWAKKHQKSTVAIRPVELGELDYDTHPANDKDAFIHQARHLADKILHRLNLNDCSTTTPYILNPHNANLGKNPRLTLALKLLADRIEQDNLPIRLWVQMHDFAEDHRPHCWQALQSCTGHNDTAFAVEMMYPTNPSIHWVTINSTDKAKLESTGLNPQTISVLPNAVEIETFTSTSLLNADQDQLNKLSLKPTDFAQDLPQRIATFATEKGFTFDPNRKIILSPIKVIRRKNIIESIFLLLWLNAQNDTHQLLITLNANSPEDIAYSRAIENIVKQNCLPVVIGFGHQLAGPQAQIESGHVKAYGLINLMALSDAVITTSIQEGFGYVFHEPWLAHKAVLGRNINMVTSDFIEQGLRLDHLYEHLLIPQSWLGEMFETMLQSYGQKITRLRREAGLDPVGFDRLEADIRRAKLFHLPACPEPMVDFADLDQSAQLHIINGVIKAKLSLSAIVAVDKSNRPRSNWYQPENSDMIEHNRQVVTKRYGLKAQAGYLERLLKPKLGTGSFRDVTGKTADQSTGFPAIPGP